MHNTRLSCRDQKTSINGLWEVGTIKRYHNSVARREQFTMSTWYSKDSELEQFFLLQSKEPEGLHFGKLTWGNSLKAAQGRLHTEGKVATACFSVAHGQ